MRARSPIVLPPPSSLQSHASSSSQNPVQNLHSYFGFLESTHLGVQFLYRLLTLCAPSAFLSPISRLLSSHSLPALTNPHSPLRCYRHVALRPSQSCVLLHPSLPSPASEPYCPQPADGLMANCFTDPTASSVRHSTGVGTHLGPLAFSITAKLLSHQTVLSSV